MLDAHRLHWNSHFAQVALELTGCTGTVSDGVLILGLIIFDSSTILSPSIVTVICNGSRSIIIIICVFFYFIFFDFKLNLRIIPDTR